MKRFLTLMMTVMMAVVAIAQDATIVLSYNKGAELKYYGSYGLNSAINDAEPNDTIYFGSGTYSLSYLPLHSSTGSAVELVKPLTFIGVGAHEGGTVLTNKDEHLYIILDSKWDKDKRNVSFEGVAFDLKSTSYYTSYTIANYSDIGELKFVNVKGDFFENSGNVDKVIVDRSNFVSIDMGSRKCKQININNSKISVISGSCDDSYGVAVLDHCYIDRLDGSFKGLIQHSLIEHGWSDYVTLENCGYSSCNDNALRLESFIISSEARILDDDPSSLGKCKDGTAYGTMGGKTPYTLYSQYPTPDTSIDPGSNKPKSFLDYDPLNKKLTITIKRLGE